MKNKKTKEQLAEELAVNIFQNLDKYLKEKYEHLMDIIEITFEITHCTHLIIEYFKQAYSDLPKQELDKYIEESLVKGLKIFRDNY